MDMTHSLREHRSCGQYLDLFAALYGGAVYGIGGYQQLYGAFFDLLYALFLQHNVGQESIDVVCALVLKAVGNVYKGTAGDGKVIYYDTVLALYVADYLQNLGILIVAAAHLVADGYGTAQLVCHGAGALGAACVGRYNYQVIIYYAKISCICTQELLGVKMINGLLEEALYLSGVKVHGYHAVCACKLYALRAYPAADGYAGLVLFVALSIAEIRNYSGNAVCTGTLKGVQEEQQLCKFVVRVQTQSLNKVHVLVADTFVNAYECVSLGKYQSGAIAHGAAQIFAHLTGKFLAGAACKNLDYSFGHKYKIPLIIVLAL